MRPMQLSASLLGLTAAVTLITGSKQAPLPNPPTTPSLTQSAPATPLAKDILNLVNVERKKRKLTPLTLNAKLSLAAQRHADDMIARKYFAHINPEKKTAEDRITATGYFAYTCVCSVRMAFGENIAKGQTTAEKVMQDWMKSPVHQGNILKPNFREMGIGFKEGIWVQTFGTMEILY